MRAMALGLIVMALMAPTAGAMDQPDAQLLLDLELLRERDPRVQRDEAVARHFDLLELLERLHEHSARRGRDAPPAPKDAC